MRLIVVKWDTSWLRETVFNDRVSSSRASFSRFVLRSSGKTEESQGGGRVGRERERLSSEGMTISYSHLEDSLNMHETIAYLMQLAEASLFSSSLSAYSSVIFFTPFLSLISRDASRRVSWLYHSHARRLLPRPCVSFRCVSLSSNNEWWKTCSNQDAFVISAGRHHRCKLHFE